MLMRERRIELRDVCHMSKNNQDPLFEKVFRDSFERFLKAGQRNCWLAVHPLKMYVRRNCRCVEGGTLTTAIDIASVEVLQSYQSQGYFKSALDVIIECTPNEVLYVENVLNERFSTYFMNNGWTLHMVGGIPSYYKRVRTQESD